MVAGKAITRSDGRKGWVLTILLVWVELVRIRKNFRSNLSQKSSK